MKFSLGANGAALGLGLLWLMLRFPLAIQIAVPMRYLGDLLALLFLIGTSAWGWKPWLAVGGIIVITRSFWIVAKLQHWAVAFPMELSLYAFVLIVYGFRFFSKKPKRLLDHLKLLWVCANCATVLLSILYVGSALRFSIALALSVLLQTLVILQWRQLPDVLETPQDWDFEQRRV